MTHLINYDRKQALKTWKPIQPLILPTEIIQYYDQKIQYVCDKERCDSLPACHLINIEDLEPLIDVNYVKYVALKHIDGIIQYIKSKGVVLEDIEWNIRQILNKIINNTVDEDYYLNTIEIYHAISGNNYDDENIYDLINQAIRLDNKRILYYLIFKEDEEMAGRVYEVIGE